MSEPNRGGLLQKPTKRNRFEISVSHPQMPLGTEIDSGGRGGIGCKALDFDDLPEVCIANVLSFTSPRDACRLSLVSTTFRSAADLDAVWDKFLPPDYQDIIFRSSAASALYFSSKKQLYLTLAQKPLLIDDCELSFFLDKWYGKKCYMLSARTLSIVWADTPRYWKYTSLPETRFAEVAELISVCWLEIRGRISTCMLSPETLYTAYLVFKPTIRSYGFDYQPVEAAVGLVGGESHNRTIYLDAEKERRRHYQNFPMRAALFSHARVVDVQAPMPGESVDGQYPKERDDGWLESELGDFFYEGREDGELEMGVSEVKGGGWKGGLIVQGIEIRPKETIK
ncbi:F-box protein family [Quillaja saponaria]|uniref:F-box protein family n=1 Tax=Quillaja saponaria TaxID=32244 RepID=A0AAD7Q2D2_QUISA|nr:F-box protein family [Quillaja saponaria]